MPQPQDSAVATDGSYTDVLQALAAETQTAGMSLALLMVDIADIPALQARLGFARAATLLAQLSLAFARIVLGRGSVIRMGDGRCCIIIRGIRNRGHALLAADKLLRVADDLMIAESVAIKPRMHVGVALYPVQAADPPLLLRCAQLAAVAADGQSIRVQVYDERCAERVLKSWELSAAFTRALDVGELSVFYQPKIRMADGRTSGVEALMRWFQEGKPVAGPDVFVPLAEEAGLIHQLTWYALSNALRLSAECGRLSVAVNVTPPMLHHREFMDMVQTAVSTWGVRENHLTLEITEGALMVDFEQASRRLSKLRDFGLRISIDDFGTGYSSLSYFKRIPADELKVDKSFVMRMLEDPADHRLVATIIGLAQHFKLETVAEGVEDRATYEALASMGCNYAQGYLFSPAVSAANLLKWLELHPLSDGPA